MMEMSMAQTTAIRRYLGVDDMRRKLGNCGRSTLFRWEEAGEIPQSLKIGARRLWDEVEVDAHLARQHETEAV